MATVRPRGIPNTVSMPACSRTRTIASGTLTVSVSKRSVVMSPAMVEAWANVCAGGKPLPSNVQRGSVQPCLEGHGNRIAQALCRMAGSLGMRGEPAHLFSARWTDHLQFDGHLLEVGGRVVDVVLLGIAKRGAAVGGALLDRDLIQRREPRHLREQSKRGGHHQVLER